MNTEKQLLEDRYILNKKVADLQEKLAIAEQSQEYMLKKNRELEKQLAHYKHLVAIRDYKQTNGQYAKQDN